MRLHTGIQVNEITLLNNLVTVDLMPEVEGMLQGSLGSILTINSLYLTLASFPGVEGIEVLMGGERHVQGNHFSFEGRVVVADPYAEEIWEREGVSGRLRFAPTNHLGNGR